MFTRACFGVLLLLSTIAWSQVDTNGTEPDTNPVDVVPMRTPPPVSGAAYSTAFASETQSNNLRAGLTFGTAYSNNVQGGTNPVGDVSYSIWPTLALDATTTRMHWDLDYAPGFTFYQHTSSLNQGNQNVAADFQYRLSPHIAVSLRDSFQKTSNPFNQPNPLWPRQFLAQRLLRGLRSSYRAPTNCTTRLTPSSLINSVLTAWSG